MRDIKDHLRGQGIKVKNEKPRNGYKDIVPNAYIKRL